MKFGIFVFFVLCSHNVYGYNILGVFHTSGKSHYILGSSLMKGLAEAGHNVTIVAAYKQENPVKNMREILLNMPPAEFLSKVLYQIKGKSTYQQFKDMVAFGIMFTNETLNDPNMKNLMRSGEKFDIVIAEIFYSESLLGLGKVFDAHMVGFSTFGAAKSSTDLNGSPSPVSYVPHFQFTYPDRMNFCQRLANTILTTFENIFMYFYYDHRQEAVYQTHFAEPKEKLEVLRKSSMSVIFLNSHFSLSYPRPNLPNLVEIGGFHINKKRNPLPKDLQEFLDIAPNGVIYFSMGSTLRGADLPTEKRDALLKVFGKLPVKVLWKWEDDTLPGKPENVLIRKWFPQDDILAHPNVRLFITHGGLLSTMEATHYGVPVLGIPVFGDQGMNMAKVQAAGYGLTVTFENLTEESISWAINEMLKSEKYSVRAQSVSSRFRDQLEDPMSRAVYWVEYVARHEGAKHLVSGGQELNFIQYHNLDVFAILTLLPIVFVIGLKRLLRKMFIKTSQNQDFIKKYK